MQGIIYALTAAVLFGISTPLAKLLLDLRFPVLGSPMAGALITVFLVTA